MSTTFDNRIGPELARRAARRRAVWLLGGLASVILGLQTATTAFAWLLDCDAALGPGLGCFHAPWAILGWSVRWHGTHPTPVARAWECGLWLSLTVFLGLAVLHARSQHPGPFLHGSARWANAADLRRAGLLQARTGPRTALTRVLRSAPANAEAPVVYVGAFKDHRGNTHYLTHSGPEHVLAMAPTRSGKGVGLVLPTLLAWAESAFVVDLKGELFELTAGWRHRCADQTVLRFEPASSERSVAWNPLAEIRIGTDHEVGDVQNLALMLVDPDGKGVEADHWRSTAMGLLVGVILHVLQEQPQSTSLATVNTFLSDPKRPADALWMDMLQSPVAAVAAEGRKMLNRPQEEAGSVLSTALRCLSLYLDPVVARNTSRSDFRIRDLMHADTPVSLYFVTQPADKDRLLPLARIFVSMTLRLLSEPLKFKNGQPEPSYRHRLLMMMDEFIALKRLSILQEALAYIAGYGIKCYLVCQDRQQLTSRHYGYGPDETITGNAHIQAALRPDKVETAEYISRKCGQTTIPHQQVTRSGHGLFAKTSRTTHYAQRPLMTPDECMRLPGPKVEGDRIVEGGDMLLFAAGMPAARGPQPLYFQDPVFRARAAVRPPRKPMARALTSRRARKAAGGTP